MTLQWIPLSSLRDHPENANRMPPRLVAKLKAHIARTGRYEPLVVRPLPDHDKQSRGGSPHPPRATPSRDPSRDPSRVRKHAGTPEAPGSPGAGEAPAGEGTRRLTAAAREGTPRYQILNGHHRARVLRDLGHTHARCDVWEVDEEEARLLLATLNRLEGRDDPSARAALLSRLAEGRCADDLARLLPEPPDALARLRRLAEPPPAPADPADAGPLPRAMTFFLDEDQAALVREALRAAKEERGGSPDPPRAGRNESGRFGPRTSRDPTRVREHAGTLDEPRAPAAGDASADDDTRDLAVSARRAGSNGKGPPRAEALVRLAQWYLSRRDPNGEAAGMR